MGRQALEKLARRREMQMDRSLSFGCTPPRLRAVGSPEYLPGSDHGQH
jgi:hypothetical protein